MSYVLFNGHTYISTKPNGKFTATYDVNLAVAFGNKKKAEHALDQLQPGYKDAGYAPKPLESCTTRVLKPKPQQHSGTFIKAHTKDSEWMAEFKRNLLIVDRTLGNMKEEYARLYEELNNTCDEIDDIMHAMEIKDVNACKANKLEVEMKKARRKRRECKNAMELMEMVMKFTLDDWGTGELEDAISHMNNCAYHPKVRPDLFE